MSYIKPAQSPLNPLPFQRPSKVERGQMFCEQGFVLAHQFQDAAQARDLVLAGASLGSLQDSEQSLAQARHLYMESFLGWVSHRAFCVECRSAYPQATWRAAVASATASAAMPSETPPSTVAG